MKRIWLLIMISLLLASCHKDKPIDVQPYIPVDLIGKWKITEICDTDGGSPPQWRNFNTGEEYDVWFKNNSEYIFTGSGKCISGKYSVSEALKITFTNSCGETYVQTIDSLSTHELIIDTNFWETIILKYVKVGE